MGPPGPRGPDHGPGKPLGNLRAHLEAAGADGGPEHGPLPRGVPQRGHGGLQDPRGEPAPAGVDGRDPLSDYRNLREELKLYRQDLAERPYAVVANKMDLPEAAGHLRRFIEETGEQPIPVCAETGEGAEEVKVALRRHFHAP